MSSAQRAAGRKREGNFFFQTKTVQCIIDMSLFTSLAL